MNPYEYETTLDCRDHHAAITTTTGQQATPNNLTQQQANNILTQQGGISPSGSNLTPRQHQQHMQQLQQQLQQQQSTLQHQNQQNMQLQQQQQQQPQSHYDYEYQHLPHRPSDPNTTAPRTHGRQGFLLEGVTPTAPPDVPPRNPTMSRMNNGRLVAGNSNDLGVDFEPSCLVRTPSGNVYIPSGNININNKGSPIDYKSGSACSTPTKDTLKGYERGTNNCMGPVLPPRSVMSGIPAHHYSAPMNFRKDLAARCNAKCIAIVSVSVTVALLVLIIFLASFGGLHWSRAAPCTVLVGNDATEVTAAKSTNTDLYKLHNSSLRSRKGQTLSATASTASSLAAGGGAVGLGTGLQATSASSIASPSSISSPTSSLSSSLANANGVVFNKIAQVKQSPKWQLLSLVAAKKHVDGGTRNLRRAKRSNINNSNEDLSFNNGNDDTPTSTPYKVIINDNNEQQPQQQEQQPAKVIMAANAALPIYSHNEELEKAVQLKSTVGKAHESKTTVVISFDKSQDVRSSDDSGGAEDLQTLSIDGILNLNQNNDDKGTTTASGRQQQMQQLYNEDDAAIMNNAAATKAKVLSKGFGLIMADDYVTKPATNWQIPMLQLNKTMETTMTTTTTTIRTTKLNDKDTVFEHTAVPNEAKDTAQQDGNEDIAEDDDVKDENDVADEDASISLTDIDNDVKAMNNINSIKAATQASATPLSLNFSTDTNHHHHPQQPTLPMRIVKQSNDLKMMRFNKPLNSNLRMITLKAGKRLKKRHRSTASSSAVLNGDEADEESDTDDINELKIATMLMSDADIADDGDDNRNDRPTMLSAPPSTDSQLEVEKQLEDDFNKLMADSYDDGVLARVEQKNNFNDEDTTDETASKNDGQLLSKPDDDAVEAALDSNNVSSATEIDNYDQIHVDSSKLKDDESKREGKIRTEEERDIGREPVTEKTEQGRIDMTLEEPGVLMPHAAPHSKPNEASKKATETLHPVNSTGSQFAEAKKPAALQMKSNAEEPASLTLKKPEAVTISLKEANTATTAINGADDLMLNDAGQLPLTLQAYLINELNEDIDIIKLEEDEKAKQKATAAAANKEHSPEQEQEIYKTVLQPPPQAKPIQILTATSKPPPLPAIENEVLKQTEMNNYGENSHWTPLKPPVVNEVYDKPSKRILVNLTITTADADGDSDGGDTYTFHVAVPLGGKRKQQKNAEQKNGSEEMESDEALNIEQVLIHEPPRRRTKPNALPAAFDDEADDVPSPYCVPEPPPKIPESLCCCPCKCGLQDDDVNANGDHNSDHEDFSQAATPTAFNKDNDDSAAVDYKEVVNTSADTATELPPTDGINNDTDSLADTSAAVTATASTESTTISFTNADGVVDSKLACPDVMPILILEGARTFPAHSFPPDGTTFGQITLGQKLTKEILPYSYWNMQFYQSEAAYLKFDYTIPRGASIGVYGRRNALPTHTQYHFKEVLSGFSSISRTARAAQITREVTRYMEQGHWFVSLYNDDGDAQEVTFHAAIAEDMTQNCPNGCSGNGQCLLGHCQCNPGFGGDDCSESVCPLLCSQHGEYINGECICNPGWKGKECSLRHDECEVADCNGHGHCVSGKCQCMRGYKGKFCEEVDCPHPTCSGHGFCADGTCICKKGWKGADCATMDQDALQCLPDCSGHGNFDLDTQTCICENKWSGDDCSKELCDLDCGQHGRCVGDACVCDGDWGGEFCNTKLCDARCNEHGQCKNGTCLCVTGWNGKHCTIEGCPNSCAGHGQCRVSGEGQWECRCYEGWDGVDCGIALELNCGDSKDNDKDGLVDCEDPECCSSHVCKTSQLCVSAPKPIDVLLRKQPPAITASFFERMKFLIDESSLQNYAKLETFNESRSAVIRGRVVTSLGMGLVGVRVSTTTLLEGFTLTRDDGWFDLMVNGGGAVTLQFGRSPFRPQSRIVHVPWNEVIIIDVVVMSMSEEKNLNLNPHTCFSHDYDLMKPVVLASWKHGFQGACPDRSAILAESQVVQESLQIPGTGLNLVYHSSRAAGYLSTIKLQLTPETIPDTLHLIHLRITIEGILFERVFEADPGIKFTYAWNRLNIYRQRVYGVTTAVVKVGYQYTDCKDIIWDVQTTKLSGHDMSISEVGGWNLDIHHRYNFHEGILQKGDGSNIYLKNKPRVILTTMGDGHQRPLDCTDCEGLALKQRLLAPVALAAAPDGSLYVGDFNYIRRILTDGTIRTVVKLNATRVSYRYHMALSPLDGSLFISDPESHQIIRVRDTNDFTQPEKNWEAVVGSGERCLPGDEAHCGDGALAKDAKLAYPKGIAISSDNILYFADGTNIRMVDRDNIVSTLIGNHMHKSHWKPIPCEGTLKLEEMHLRWPTELSVSPLDNTLHIIDDHMILRMTPDGRVRVISGRPLHCATASSVFDTDLATHATLVMPQSIAFGPMGELYVAESDSQRINRVRVIGTDGRIQAFAGAESKCNCLERGCDCFEADHFLATSAKFNTIAALAVTPDGHVHIADQANYRIRSVMSSIPEASSSREYEIYAPDMQEIYIFNRFGQHVLTRNILTGETTYVFTYNVNTSNGKLSTVTDAAGNKVFLLRDYTSQVNSIENTKGQKCHLRMTRMKMLHELGTPDNFNVTFEYHGPTGLLKTKLDTTGRSYVYNYDEFGRLTSAVTPTGRVIDLSFDLSVKGAQVKVSENSQKEVSMLIQGSSVVVRNGEAETKTSIEIDGSTTSVTPWGHTFNMEVVPYAILAEVSPLIGESYPVPAKQRTEIAGDLANRFEWRYFVRRIQQGKQGKGSRPVQQVGRKLRVNGDNVLTLEYDRETMSVVVMVDDKQELLNVTYDRTARPVSFRPQSGDYADVDLEYDRFGRLVSWKWGVLQESYSFDRNGRLIEIKYGDGFKLNYEFRDMYATLPQSIYTPMKTEYMFQYDDSGALQKLVTPRGHIHNFILQTSLGFFKYQYYSPINRHPFEILYNDEGQILSKNHPHQSGKVAFVHDAAGRLETILAGLSSTHYSYQDTTSLLKSVEVQEPGFELRREFKYHAGILKDEKLRFGPKNALASVHYKYTYDGNARLSGIEMSIDDKELPALRYKYSQNLGQLEVVQDLKITRNAFNRTVIQDTSKQFFAIIDYDQHGRIKSVLMNIKSLDVFRLELDYDLRNRIKSQKTTLGRSTAFDKISYDADGHVKEVQGTNHWRYTYDDNGNAIGVADQNESVTYYYDVGDRIELMGEVEYVDYDARGYVVRRGDQKYRYNNRGQLIHAFERERFQTWYYYDDRNRLIAWHDNKGNVTQYYYANPNAPQRVSHVHFPKVNKTMRFFYDDRDMLVALEHNEQRLYVATDQNGSPLAYFDLQGAIVKEMKRTPFGRIIKDTNPDFFVPIDFHGGLIDFNTKLIYTEGRQYDPAVGQWLTPLWETLATEMSNPTDVFIYRYHNNDPINTNKPQNYMIDLDSWLKLFGYDLANMQSSKYTQASQYRPQASIKSNTLAPDFGVMSGLECIVHKINQKFSDFDFVPKPLLKMEPKMRNLLPRVAYLRGVFGEGVLLSRIGGRAMVSVVDGSNSVVQDVVSSVFNNSYFLDLHFSIHDQDVFYFVKDNVLKVRDDNEELRRLGGMFNITTHDTTDHTGLAGKELRLHGPDAVVIIKYGVDPEQERHRILKHAHKRAVDRAWELEKELVAAGFQGRGDWTEEEKEELVSHGDVDGWIGIDIHSIHKYPQLADDPGNVAFQRDAKRKRRKIGASHRVTSSKSHRQTPNAGDEA